MAQYTTELPSLHLTFGDLSELTSIFMDSNEDKIEIKVTEGGLTKQYNSISGVREDATLPDDLQNIKIRMVRGDSKIRIRWDSSGPMTTSRVSIEGSEEFVKSKKEDLESFFDNHKVSWRTFLDGILPEFAVGIIISIISGLISSIFLPPSESLTIAIIVAGLVLIPLQWGINYIYPKIILTRNSEAARVRYTKTTIKVIITILTLIAAVISIINFVSSN